MLPTMVAPTSTSTNGPASPSKTQTTRSLRAKSPGTPRAVTGFTEIKRAQELGLPHYPVFTHKPHTDVSYLACARLISASQ